MKYRGRAQDDTSRDLPLEELQPLPEELESPLEELEPPPPEELEILPVELEPLL